MKLIKLHVMGSRWYAGIQDGNLTVGGLFGAPTEFPASMKRSVVLAEMIQRTPDLEIDPVICGELGKGDLTGR